ncbi:hypothetical protein OCOJLMKI_2766 [Methylobacterium iners]|uniref:Uncharacterized protein n=1 Tax=Methylobacterium iners TaxID=418707 RepID=A0ABQ4S130_9HYPH|nr:hypothetical protein OCOJLMKI_2766 [Methylobacterium iners]
MPDSVSNLPFHCTGNITRAALVGATVPRSEVA